MQFLTGIKFRGENVEVEQADVNVEEEEKVEEVNADVEGLESAEEGDDIWYSGTRMSPCGTVIFRSSAVGVTGEHAGTIARHEHIAAVWSGWTGAKNFSQS